MSTLFLPDFSMDWSTKDLEAGLARLLGDPRLAKQVEKGLLVACSGGCDSMALLVLCDRFSGRKIRLEVAHVHHGIRREADMELAFVEDMCCRMQRVCHRSFLQWDKEHVSENDLRRARQDELRGFLESGGLGLLLLGHTAGDQAETVIMHLLRGSGLQGMGGMRVVDGPVVRPLLGCSRRILEQYLAEQRMSWCEDESNESGIYLRNRVRSFLIPWLVRENPQVVQTLCRTAEIMHAGHGAMVHLASEVLQRRETWMPGMLESLVLDQHGLREPGIIMETVRQFWRRMVDSGNCRNELGSAVVLEITETVLGAREGSWNLPGRVLCQVQKGRLVLRNRNQPMFGPQEISSPGHRDGYFLLPHDPGSIQAGEHDFPLTLRRIHTGDRMARRDRKVVCRKALSGLPSAMRDLSLVLENASGEIIWCQHIGPAWRDAKTGSYQLGHESGFVPG